MRKGGDSNDEEVILENAELINDFDVDVVVYRHYSL